MVIHRFCSGPAHGGETVSLPVTEEYWYFYRSDSGKHHKGELKSPCKLCWLWKQAIAEGRVPGVRLIECEPIKKYLEELVQRCGSVPKAAKYAGITKDTIFNILYREQCTLRSSTAGRILRALDERRREDRRLHATSDRYRHTRQQEGMAIARLDRR